MGFLDRISKTIGSMRDAAAKLDRAPATSSASDTSTAQPAPYDPSRATGLDSADPLRWMTPGDVAAATGVAVGPAVAFETPDTFGARFAAEGGAVFELRSLSEDVLVRGGTPSRWIDEQAAAYPQIRPVPGFGDYALACSDGPDRGACFVAAADSCFAAYATGPGLAEARAAEALLRRLYDWPE